MEAIEMKCNVYYYEDEQGNKKWKCSKYLMCSGISFSESLTKCYHYKCKGRKPNFKVCAWKDCEKPVAPNKVRHCSEVCRKRDNRWAYRMRQKNKNKPQ